MNLDEETANECEINMIKNLRDAGFELYNVSNGGKAAFKGMHLSEENKKKISESNKGRPPTTMSPEGKKRLINSLIGNKNALGYRHSEETRKKISSSLTGKNVHHLLWNIKSTLVRAEKENHYLMHKGIN